ncbi:MAG TPA: exodeoxyribonuclease III [Acidimicrobiales bacterium]|nr:exodeoxyribonuclease III [Acidimicrobiales bacterium]
MRIATWNVNSLKVRLPRVEEWLAYARPDVLCMQETKLADGAFPSLAFAALGYEAAHCGQGRWNGVAILSRVGLDDVVAGFSDESEDETTEARLLWATCGGVRVGSVYVPNGRMVGSEFYEAKLAWLARLHQHLVVGCDPAEPLVLCGDFNVAPDDRDVWDATKLHGATHVSPPEREAVAAMTEWGLVDVFRQLYTEERLFSWWDYRAGDFHQGRGLRIDLILATRVLADRLTWALIDRFARKGKLPSDHAPLLADFG